MTALILTQVRQSCSKIHTKIIKMSLNGHSSLILVLVALTSLALAVPIPNPISSEEDGMNNSNSTGIKTIPVPPRVKKVGSMTLPYIVLGGRKKFVKKGMNITTTVNDLASDESQTTMTITSSTTLVPPEEMTTTSTTEATPPADLLPSSSTSSEKQTSLPETQLNQQRERMAALLRALNHLLPQSSTTTTTPRPNNNVNAILNGDQINWSNLITAPAKFFMGTMRAMVGMGEALGKGLEALARLSPNNNQNSRINNFSLGAFKPIPS